MRKDKIIVVGAGPAGSSCALTLARSALSEVLLLDRSTYPRLKVCGSGLSPQAVDELRELGLASRFLPQALHMAGIVARGPGGATVRLRGATGAMIVPRTEFDHGLVEEAARAGAEFREGVRVDGLLRDDNGQVRGVQTADGQLEADLVVCANGSLSKFERDTHPRYGIRTIMGWWRGAEFDESDMGTMIWDRRLEGYYAWMFPEPNGVVNIGLTIPETAAESHHLRGLFAELLGEYFRDNLRNAEQIGSWKGHPVTVTTRVGDIAEARALWVGEAARLVSPGTVEGIGFALQSGALAGQILNRHATSKDGLSTLHQAEYRARIAQRMIPKFWAGEAVTRIMRSQRALRITAALVDPERATRAAAALMDKRPDEQTERAVAS